MGRLHCAVQQWKPSLLITHALLPFPNTPKNNCRCRADYQQIKARPERVGLQRGCCGEGGDQRPDTEQFLAAVPAFDQSNTRCEEQHRKEREQNKTNARDSVAQIDPLGGRNYRKRNGQKRQSRMANGGPTNPCSKLFHG